MGIARSTYYHASNGSADDTALVEAMHAIKDEFEDTAARRFRQEPALRRREMLEKLAQKTICLTIPMRWNTPVQRRSKIGPKGGVKLVHFSVMRYAVLRVVPLVHRRAPRCFA